MDRLKKFAFMAIAALAMVLAVNAPNQARAMDGQGFGGGHPGGVDGHHDFERHHVVDRHHDFHRDVHGGFRFGVGVPVYPYYYPPAYGYAARTYWYYCPSYGAYYPYVTSCPQAWVPVPAS